MPELRRSAIAVLVSGMLLSVGALAGCSAPESRTVGATPSQSPTRIAESERDSGADTAAGTGPEATADTATGAAASRAPTEQGSPGTSKSSERTSFADGVVRVGDRVEEGSYTVTGTVGADCVLSVEVDKTGVNLGGEEINVTGTGVELGDVSTSDGVTRFEIVAGRPSVALAEGDTVTSQGCGTWQLQ